MDEEDLNASKRRKIEDTVSQILGASNLEVATELSVRAAAEERLGLSLSGLSHRRLVQQLVDSFLLSTARAALGTSSPRRNNHGNGNSDVESGDYNGKVICKLSDKRMVTVHDGSWTTMVEIRDFDLKGGNLCPKKDHTPAHETSPEFDNRVDRLLERPAERRKSYLLTTKENLFAAGLRSTDPTMSESGVDSGLSLTPAQWSSFRNSFPSIQEAIVKMESRLRRKNAVHPSNNLNQTPEGIARQSEADMTHSSVDCAAEKSQTEADIPNSTSIFRPVKTEQVESEPEITNPTAYSLAENHSIAERNQLATSDSGKIDTVVSIFAPPFLVPPFPNQSHLLDAFSGVRPELLIPDDGKQSEADISKSAPAFQLVPIQPVRLDGRNYHSWRHQIRFLLNQLNIAYVLAEPCPSISSNSEAIPDEKVKVRAAIQRWTNDDYMCRHNILNSLSDHLFQLHSPKTYSAGELWDDLRLAYDEDFGTKRSQINKYIQFQMVDGVSILDQAQELGKIADSIIASGTWVDESFHVGIIVSKLPHSWKEFRIRLMREEFLPLNMLMRRLQVEEESRRKESDFKKGLIEPRFDSRLGVRKQGSKRICYCCGQDGHISMNCPNRKFEGHEKINDKENGHPSPRKHKRNR